MRRILGSLSRVGEILRIEQSRSVTKEPLTATKKVDLKTYLTRRAEFRRMEAASENTSAHMKESIKTENETPKTAKNSETCNRKRPRKRTAKQQQLHATFKRPKVTSEDSMTKTTYYFENGLRKVVPYDHKYNTFCKGRWRGKTLREVYTSEFRLYPIEHYERAVKEKRLLVNLEPVKSLDRVLKSNDLLTSVVHRHECPVADVPIEVIADTDEFFVINKPCSIPLHPVGRFRFNTVISILAKEHNQPSLFSVHRIDRMTSGVLLFAKSSKISTKIHKLLVERQLEKEYLCRVVGDFSKFTLPDGEHRIKIEGSEVTVSEPLKIYDMKIGIVIVKNDETSKESETVFKCLSTDGKTSVVSCKPKTGRTHQIRVHLQYLGYPITNDPVYNNPAWGEERFKFGPITKPMDDVMLELSNAKKWSAFIESAKIILEEKKVGEVEKSENENSKSSSVTLEKEKVFTEPKFPDSVVIEENMIPFRSDCEECRRPLSDPKPDELIMYLHALRYKGPDWEFKTPAPKWADPDWVEERTDFGASLD